MNSDLWHFDGQAYRLVNPQLVSYPLEKTVIVAGKKVIERSRIEYTICTAERVK